MRRGAKVQGLRFSVCAQGLGRVLPLLIIGRSKLVGVCEGDPYSWKLAMRGWSSGSRV